MDMAFDITSKGSKRPSFNIGIEEEYQTIDPVTRDLRSHIHAEILEKGRLILAERVKPEMHQSVVEIGTGVCANIKDAKKEIREIRRQIITLARDNGLCQRCLPDVVRVATEVHHIREKARGGTDRLENLISTCKTCHRAEHGVVIRHGFDRHGRSLDPASPWSVKR